MRRKGATRDLPRLVCAGSALVLSSCGEPIELGHDVTSSCQFAAPDEASEIELSTFRSADEDESRALDVLADRASTTGRLLSHTALKGRPDLHSNLAEWFAQDGDVPDVYQVNGGSDVLQYLTVSGRDDLCSLESLSERYEFRSLFLEAALGPSSCNGELFALPIGVHRLNNVFVNQSILEQAQSAAADQGQTLPEFHDLKTADDFVDFLEQVDILQLRDHTGTPIRTLSLGMGIEDDQSWTLQHIAFENLLVASGEGIYESIWMGANSRSHAELEAATTKIAAQVRTLGRLAGDLRRLDWDQTIDEVVAGQALLTVGGDWLLAQIPPGQRGGIVAHVFPGTAKAFVYTPDSFAVPRQAGVSGAAAHAWLWEVVADESTQLEFAALKQAIPTLADLDADALSRLESDYLTQSYQQFSACNADREDCRLLLAVSGLGPPPGSPCWDRIGYVLAMLAGEAIPSDEWPTSECPWSVPESDEDALKELTLMVLEHSREPFAAGCRE